MSNKKYYWLKLHKDFFKSKEMKKLRKIAGGDTYTIIYLKLQLLSLDHNGKLFFDGVDDSFAEELALEIDESTDNVQATFIFLQKVGLLEMVQEDELSLTHVVENIGSETPSAARKRRQRSKQQQQLTDESVTLSQVSHKKVTTEKEIELDTEIKIDINTPPTPSKGKRFVAPSVDQVKEYCQEKGYAIDPEAYCDFYASKGWMVGKNKMKDWKAAVRNAHRNGYFRANQTPQNNSNSIEGFKWGQN